MDPNRREFLAAAGAVSQAGGAGALLRSQGKPMPLGEDLWVFGDTCNVYIVRDRDRAVLIDFGSGAVLDHLPALGISGVDWILHTHHHRDQCQGDHKAVERRIPIAVPAHERHLFEDAENFWRNRRVFHLYYVRNDFNTLTRNVPVARPLEDYATFRWREAEFLVQPTPGHTLGSVALILNHRGRRIAFTGDLLYAPGKILNLYDTQATYAGLEGIDLGVYSLERLRELKPELLCPSHGDPIADPEPAIHRTVQALADYHRFQAGSEPTVWGKPFAVSPHLVAHHQTASSFYAIISDSGKAMFIDYGSASWLAFQAFERATATADRIRFVEHSIGELRRTYGLKSVDVAMPTHMHDDHLNGFPHLVRSHGTQVWCYENMLDVLEKPRGHNLGCILGEPFQVKRTFRHGERFRWEEFEFEITHSPGHTEYQMALYVTLDGRRVAFTGDAFFETQRDGAMRHNTIFRNHVENDSHLKSIRNLIAHEPELICPGHGRPFAVTRTIMETTEAKFKKQQQLFFELLPDGQTDFGLDPSWVSLYPYQLLLTPGTRSRIEARVRNYHPGPMKLEIALVTPPEWRVEPDVARFEAPGGGKAAQTFEISVPASWRPAHPRFAIAADVVSDGRYLGQITEAVVELSLAAG